MAYNLGDVKLWWDEKNYPEPHKEIFAAVQTLYQEQIGRHDRNNKCVRLYGNVDFVSGIPSSLGSTPSISLTEDRVRLNVVANMVDTVTAKIAKMRPRVTFLTDNGKRSSQKNAQRLSQVVLGAFKSQDVYKKHQVMFKDAAILDKGAIKHYRDGNHIVSERVLATELLVDEVDAMYGSPRTMYQFKFVAKELMKQLYPKMKVIIETSGTALDGVKNADKAMEHYVLVVEAWHLPATRESGDGRHVICVENGVLFDEEYKRNKFPFTFFNWKDRHTGFWGQSLTEELMGNQLEINKMLRIIQKSFHLGSAFKVFLEYGSRVAKEHLNNQIGSIVYYMGAKPEFYTPRVIHPEYFQHLDWLIKRSYEIAGISQLSASSQKPSGLDAGKAIREYNDIETQRFAIVSQNYESSFLETADHYLDLMKEIYEEGGDFEVIAESKDLIESIKWSELDYDKNIYVMQMFPTSMLPAEPSARLQVVQELVQAGVIPQDWMLYLLDFPDVKSFTSLKTAALEDIMDTIDHMLDGGDYVAPEPYQDLVNGIPHMQLAYNKAKRQGADEEVLDNMRRWMDAATNLMNKAQASQAPAAPGQLLASGVEPGQPIEGGLPPAAPAPGGQIV